MVTKTNGQSIWINLSKVIVPGLGIIFLTLISITLSTSHKAVQAAQSATEIAREAKDVASDCHNVIAIHMATQLESDKNIDEKLDDIKKKLEVMDKNLLKYLTSQE